MRAPKLKVLIMIESTAIRGAAKGLLTFLDGVIRLGLPQSERFSVSIATFDRQASDADKADSEFISAVRDLGVGIQVIRERRRWDAAVFHGLESTVKIQSPDIIHTNNVKSHALIKASGLHRRYKWIATHHGYTSTDFKMKCYNQLDRWSLRSAERVILPCHAFRTQVTQCGIAADRIRIVPNSGVRIPKPPEEELQALRSRLGISAEEKVVLCIGRMSAEKGHIDLVNALRILNERNLEQRCKLILLGSGPELGHLQAAAAGLGVVSQVIFATEEADVTTFLHAADVFALPSHSDGSPHVILEAMGAGLPIVSTSVGGLPEMLAHNTTAVLVEPRRPESLAAGLERLLRCSAEAGLLAENAQAVLAKQFSPQTYVSGLLNIYADVLAA
jgi:glycosyltransferase involved in cell wall biosynthesis